MFGPTPAAFNPSFAPALPAAHVPKKRSLAMWSSTDELHPAETAPLRDIPTVGCTPPSSKAAGDRSHACIDVGAENWNSWKLGFHAESAPGDVLRRKEIELLEGTAAASLMASFIGFSLHLLLTSSRVKKAVETNAQTHCGPCAIRKHTYMFNFALDRSYELQVHLLHSIGSKL